MKRRLREHLLLSASFSRRRCGLVIDMIELLLRFVKLAFMLRLGSWFHPFGFFLTTRTLRMKMIAMLQTTMMTRIQSTNPMLVINKEAVYKVHFITHEFFKNP
ncbi:unnamed protein product [Brassica oleracea var. botrytis]